MKRRVKKSKKLRVVYQRKKKIDFKILLISFIIILFVAGIGSLLTGKTTNSEWYNQIKPSITPANWVFPVVWSILFFMIAIAFYYSLVNSTGRKRKEIIFMYICNFVLNILWSLFFFQLKIIGIAFLDLILIWVSILVLINLNMRESRISSYLLIPYLLWVSFAGIINYLAWAMIF